MVLITKLVYRPTTGKKIIVNFDSSTKHWAFAFTLVITQCNNSTR